ncbi:hypothetical protein [Companilactobacillus metriopterae]|uniref:hypothetical protein n=1 Tax=Companilactobacillus metriopterae TaxID=1909267 RepID=UPI00100B34C7|nr:hypothetical protein [Companilactobacillus metriopterae]
MLKIYTFIFVLFVDSESDVSIDELIEILSMQNSNTDINRLAKIINEVIETGTYMTIFPKLIAREYRLNMSQLALEVR